MMSQSISFYFVIVSFSLLSMACNGEREAAQAGDNSSGNTQVSPVPSMETSDPFAGEDIQWLDVKPLTEEEIAANREHDDHDHDHGHDHHSKDESDNFTIDPSLAGLPREVLRTMKDSGSFYVDMSKNGMWKEFNIQMRDSEAGAAADTVFIMKRGSYEKGNQTGKWRTYESRSRSLPVKWTLVEESEYIAGKLNGKRIVYKNGRPFFIEQLKNDKLNGVNYYYDEFGELAMEVSYRNGLKHGVLRRYETGKKLMSLVTYENDIQKGKYQHFYPDGTLKEEGFSESGLPDGNWKLYHPNGQLWTEREYKKGKAWRVLSNFTADGKPRPAGTLSGGNGTIILYETDGRVGETHVYSQGERVDPH